MRRSCDAGTGPVVDSCTSVEPSVGADDATQAHFVDNLPVGQQVGQRAHRSAAAGLQGGEQGPLGGHGGPGVRVVELGERGGEVCVDRRALDSECPLAGSGQDGVDRQEVGHLAAPAEAVEARGGQHDRVELPVVDVPDPGVDVPADRHGLYGAGRGSRACALSCAMRRGGARADAGAVAAARRRSAPSRATSTSRGSSRARDGGQDQVLGLRRGQVLQRVHGEVDLAAQQRVAQRGDEDAGAADLREVLAGGVAVRGDLDQLDGPPGQLG